MADPLITELEVCYALECFNSNTNTGPYGFFPVFLKLQFPLLARLTLAFKLPVAKVSLAGDEVGGKNTPPRPISFATAKAITRRTVANPPVNRPRFSMVGEDFPWNA